MIEITNLTKTKIDTSFLQKAARAAFAALPRRSPAKRDEGGFASLKPRKVWEEGGRGEPEISLVFVSDKKMRQFNKKYRRKNKVTDVLSFEELNEIFICLPQAKRQSRLLKTSLKLELMRLLVHGIVHLKGYEHEKSAKEAERMFGVEEKILEKIL